MRTGSSLVLGLFAASAWAAPGACKQKKAVCNADNCLRAVRATSAKPFAQSATADCSSFMRRTVTPCAATTTATTTVTVTNSPSTVTATSVAYQPSSVTVFETATSVLATVEDTITVVAASEVDVINVIVTAVTVTAAQADRRDLNIVPLPVVPSFADQVNKRIIANTTSAAPSTCAATTNAPASVPTYASACSGTVRYSSACSCAGITAAATTLAQSTVTTTSTATVQYTPTVTVTAIQTSYTPVTVVQTEIVPTTYVTTDATVVVPSLYTVTSDIVIPTTVVVSPPACTAYNFVATNGFRAGQFLSSGRPDPSLVTYSFVNLTGSPADAHTFTIRPNGRVYENFGSASYGWITNGNAAYYILQMTDKSQTVYGVRSVYCSVGRGDSSYPGAVGMLSCTSAGSPMTLEYCPQFGNNLGQTPGNSATPGCTPANLAAIPVC